MNHISKSLSELFSATNGQQTQIEKSIAAAKYYDALGLAPIPLVSKKPTKGFTYEGTGRIPSEYLKTKFTNFNGNNVGIRMGEISGHLVDVDIDCPEALAIADIYLAKTNAIFGHSNNPRSHRLYICKDANYYKFSDPCKAEYDESACLIELRAGNLYTVFPPSIHDTGAVYEWNTEEFDPSEVEYGDLLDDLQTIAAAALLARRFTEGNRHSISLCVGGMFASKGIPLPDAQTFIRAVCIASGDKDMKNRVEAVQDSYQTFKNGGKVEGIPKLVEIIGEATARKICTWLGFNVEAPTMSVEAPVEVLGRNTFKTILNAPVAEHRYIFEREIRKGIISAVIAEGGVGKSMLLMELAISACSGKTLLPMFQPSKPMKVLTLFGEDDADILSERFKSFVEHFNLTEEEIDLIDQNLWNYNGPTLPLVEVSTHNQLKKTDTFLQLEKTIEEFKPELIIIDPKSAWCSFDENNNNQTADFMRFLQNAITNESSIIVSHHLNKTMGTNVNASRGASSFTTSCRYVLSMSERRGLVHLDVSKMNYGENHRQLGTLTRSQNGVLYLQSKESEVINCICQYINKNAITKRDIDTRNCSIKSELEEQLDISIAWKDIQELISKLIAQQVISEANNGKKTMLTCEQN